MALGMIIHRLAPPQPVAPSFRILIPSLLSPRKGTIELVFYTPKSYSRPSHVFLSSIQNNQPRHGTVNATKPVHSTLINFHGGGFTIGSPTDDARWASAIIEQVPDTVVVSVGYRLAPEHRFPTATEDSTDAVIWLRKHAPELGLDAEKMGLAGFSAGGNLCFSVSLKLYELHEEERRHVDRSSGHSGSEGVNHEEAREAESDEGDDPREAAALLSQGGTRGPTKDIAAATTTSVTTHNLSNSARYTKPLSIILAFYPSLSELLPRAQKTFAQPPGPSKALPTTLTSLFDASYIPVSPITAASLSDPLFSPLCASNAALLAAVPNTVVLYTCEWDQRLAEGEEMRKRLAGMGKKVSGSMVEGAVHGWDRRPRVWGGGLDEAAVRCYREAADVLRGVWGVNQAER